MVFTKHFALMTMVLTTHFAPFQSLPSVAWLICAWDTRTHTYTHTHTHTHTLNRAHTLSHTLTLTHTRAHTNTHSLNHAHTLTHTPKSMYPSLHKSPTNTGLIHAHSHTNTHSLTHIHIHLHTHQNPFNLSLQKSPTNIGTPSVAQEWGAMTHSSKRTLRTHL